jgi:hypothetical protein
MYGIVKSQSNHCNVDVLILNKSSHSKFVPPSKLFILMRARAKATDTLT